MARCLRCRAGNEWIEGDIRVVDAPALDELCKIFRWRGGTIHQALDEVRRLKTLEQKALPPQMLESNAIALLRELNDALVIPGWLQPRVDAGRSSATSAVTIGGISMEHRFSLNAVPLFTEPPSISSLSPPPQGAKSD